ncbi:ubiquitin-specific protease ubp1 [Mucor velutinosus]|uniref:Ubiquitin-specific protease ubp1 n=1 Tax=Mucor velutinosus TaxID=708070 RepID=A0AAN7DMM7_9FUNG|nr:ubiquitin-specific protease ubp1 [Mucor velutinosus]
MKGLTDCNFNKKVYCTEESAKILPHIVVRYNKQPKYRHLQNLLIPVKYKQVVRLETPEYGTLSFQFLPANHCIGSAMILLEGANGSVLYTGDTRAEPRFYEENLSIIRRYRIQNLYMDTTCVRENAEKFISKVSVSSEHLGSIDKHHHIYIDCWTFGYEECWAEIYDTFKQKVHVSKLKYNTYVEADPIYKEYLTTDPSTTRFHSCNWDLNCKPYEHGLVAIHFKPNMDDQPRLYIPSEKSNHLLSTDLRYDCKPQSRHILPFSFHSSLEEIIGFVNYVNAKTLTMCVARGGYTGMDEMRKLLIKRGCKLGEISHSSDYSSNGSSTGQQKRRRTSGLSFKKVMSNTAEDPDEHTPDGSGSGSSWTSRKTASQPVASSSRLNSTREKEEQKPSSHSSVLSKAGSKSQLKSSSQPHSCPAATQPLIDRTNLPKISAKEGTEKEIHSVQEREHVVQEVVETAASVTEEHTSNLERSLSWEIIAIVPNTPPPPPSPKPQDDVIVISSDDEDTKPFMTRLETRRFFRALRKCHMKNDEYIAKA